MIFAHALSLLGPGLGSLIRFLLGRFCTTSQAKQLVARAMVQSKHHQGAPPRTPEVLWNTPVISTALC